MHIHVIVQLRARAQNTRAQNTCACMVLVAWCFADPLAALKTIRVAQATLTTS